MQNVDIGISKYDLGKALKIFRFWVYLNIIIHFHQTQEIKLTFDSLFIFYLCVIKSHKEKSIGIEEIKAKNKNIHQFYLIFFFSDFLL